MKYIDSLNKAKISVDHCLAVLTHAIKTDEFDRELLQSIMDFYSDLSNGPDSEYYEDVAEALVEGLHEIKNGIKICVGYEICAGNKYPENIFVDNTLENRIRHVENLCNEIREIKISPVDQESKNYD